MEIRFEENGAKAYNDEGKEVGLCEYYEKDGKWVLNHTVVDPSMKGQGIAGKLLDCVLEHAREKKVKVVPECSYVAHAFEKNPALKEEFE